MAVAGSTGRFDHLSDDAMASQDLARFCKLLVVDGRVIPRIDASTSRVNRNDTHDGKGRLEPLRQLDRRLQGSMGRLSAVVGDQDVLHGDSLLSMTVLGNTPSSSMCSIGFVDHCATSLVGGPSGPISAGIRGPPTDRGRRAHVGLASQAGRLRRTSPRGCSGLP